ncbi:hypothetical protein F5B19DRAFT_475609 [Rostrohypoxylon terebratum]|nr:hypothetical protein F5B19DRAFT_475609 [Rostrohypoxylon terebratum]
MIDLTALYYQIPDTSYHDSSEPPSSPFLPYLPGPTILLFSNFLIRYLDSPHIQSRFAAALVSSAFFRASLLAFLFVSRLALSGLVWVATCRVSGPEK